jgi:SAM-dependent methyltransferase
VRLWDAGVEHGLAGHVFGIVRGPLQDSLLNIFAHLALPKSSCHVNCMSEFGLSAKLKENYDSYYDGESEWRTLGAVDKVNNVVGLCRSLPHQKILEIGSGDGAILQRLSELKFGEALYSIEISESAVDTIRHRMIPRVHECQLFDGYRISYPDRQFDLVVLSHVLEHVEHPRMLLYEASRVAKFIFLEVPLEDTVRLNREFVFNSVGHINFYSWKAIRHLVQSCGLKILTQTVTNPSLPVYRYCSGRAGILKFGIKELLQRISPVLACRLLTYHCSIVCEKAYQ